MDTGETTMTAFDFANDPKLAGIGAIMQRTADRRAAQGLISADGKTHATAAQMALYAAGVSPHAVEYIEAGK
jgi:hypothetical protein